MIIPITALRNKLLIIHDKKSSGLNMLYLPTSYCYFTVVKPIIEDIKITSPQSRSVHLTWTISSDSKHPIKKQELVYFLMKRKEDKKKVEIEAKKQSFKIHGLTPYSQYVVRLKAQNDYLSSDDKEITFTTATARKRIINKCIIR